MKRVLKAVTTLLLLIVAIGLAACGSDKESSPSQSQDLAAVESLVVTLATRPGVTDPAAAAMLQDAAATSAVAFRDALGEGFDLAPFSERLGPLLQTWADAYRPEAAAEEKAAAVDQLLGGLIAAAEASGIPLAKLDLAVLSAAADLQPQLSAPPLSEHFAAADRELVNTLLLAAILHVHQRTVFAQGSAAMVVLGVDAPVAERYDLLLGWVESAGVTALSSLEAALVDPAEVFDSSRLVVQQYNLLARNDLSLLRYFVDVSYYYSGPPGSMDVESLAAKMREAGGIMTAITPDDLVQAGVASSGIIDTDDGPVTDYRMPIAAFAACNWVQPGMPLTYQPVAGLAERIVQLGGEVPTPPDFSFFVDPYLSIFRMFYDFQLINTIASLETIVPEDPENPTLPTMQERLARRSLQSGRVALVMAGLAGVSDEAKEALAALLATPYEF